MAMSQRTAIASIESGFPPLRNCWMFARGRMWWWAESVFANRSYAVETDNVRFGALTLVARST
jgi:hypothetical protein